MQIKSNNPNFNSGPNIGGWSVLLSKEESKISDFEAIITWNKYAYSGKEFLEYKAVIVSADIICNWSIQELIDNNGNGKKIFYDNLESFTIIK